jgi:hypothetical protein
MINYVVIKKEFIEEAVQTWGKHTVDYVFDILSQKNPDRAIQDLIFLKEFEKLDCLLFLLQKRSKDSN